MKIAVISDTHRMEKYIKIIKEYIKEADILIHLGDNVEDIKELTKGFEGDVYGVKGNCDFSNIYPSEQILNIGGKRVFITHGHNYGVKGTLNNIYYKAKEVSADIVLFGHTHENVILKEDGIIFMNPGSVPLPRSNGRYIGFIDIEEEVEVDVYLKKISTI